MTEAQKHPLEGNYIIYNYGEQDSEREAWALALFQLVNRKMKRIYHPESCYEFGQIMEEESNERLVKIMLEKGITAVQSVYAVQDFFGIPYDWFDLSGKATEETDSWAEYKTLSEDSYEIDLLKDSGIEVTHYLVENDGKCVKL